MPSRPSPGSHAENSPRGPGGAPPPPGPQRAPRPAATPRRGLAARPVDVAPSIGSHAPLGPLLREHEELFRVDPGQRLGLEVAGEVAPGGRGRPAGGRPAP